MNKNLEGHLHKLIEYLNIARELHNDCNKFLPHLYPDDIHETCFHACQLLKDIETVIDLDGTSLIKLGNCENFTNASDDWRPLKIWGQILDTFEGPIYNNCQFGTLWEDFCLLQFKQKDRIKDENEETKCSEWFTNVIHFYDKTQTLLYQMIEALELQLLHLDFKEYPHACLALLVGSVQKFKDTFLSSAYAIGPYLPSPSSFWTGWGEDVDMEEMQDPGIIKVLGILLARGAQCEFFNDHADIIEWTVSWEDDSTIPSFNENHVNRLFDTWDYSTGEYLENPLVDGKAYWLLPDVADVSYHAMMVERELLTLFQNTQYMQLAERVTIIIKNESPVWYPSKVKWTYIKEIDELIEFIKHEIKIYLSENTHDDIIKSSSIKNIKNSTNEIPAEHKSPPMSLSEMARHFRLTSTKKIRSMIDNKAIKIEKINRQTYYFDLRTLPDYVRQKIKN